MVNKLHFPTKEAAQVVRDEYFTIYHSTCKGLTAAEADGRLPPLPAGVTLLPLGRTNIFDPNELDEYWANTLDYTLLGKPDPKCIELFKQLSTPIEGEEEKQHNTLLNIIAFSNGPRKYVLRVLQQIGLASYFTPQHIFGVTDVLPHCKPDVGSFRHVFQACNVHPHECIMVEDSMKNIRQAKALGMRTILILGKGRRTNAPVERVGEAINDSPDETDPAVDAAVEVAAEVADVLRLWGILP
jgi:putative hydrolase of the HAD superfamily